MTYSKGGGIAGINQDVFIETQNNIITISGFNSDTESLISKEDISSLWNVISENNFFELERLDYPPAVGSADYFSYSLDVTTSAKKNIISWTDTSTDFPEEFVIISQEIERLIQFYS